VLNGNTDISMYGIIMPILKGGEKNPWNALPFHPNPSKKTPTT